MSFKSKFGVFTDVQNVPKVGTQVTAGVNANLVKTPEHQVNAFVSHSQAFNNHLKPVGPGSTTVGANYNHVQGASLGVTGTQTPGFAPAGSVSTSIPLHSSVDNNTNANLYSQSNFARGMKPSHTVGVRFQHNF